MLGTVLTAALTGWMFGIQVTGGTEYSTSSYFQCIFILNPLVLLPPNFNLENILSLWAKAIISLQESRHLLVVIS